ncbi:MAG: flagellar hook-length control protein FliK [Burkholderiales bacterium]
MDPLDALTKVALLNQKLGQTFVATQEAKLPLIEVGQQVSAKVEGQLQNGNFKVNINGQSLQMNLPGDTKPGDSVNMVLISRDPRLTFKLDLPQSSTQPPQAELSQAGRLVSQLVPDASKPSVPLTSAKPVLPSPPQEPGQLAQALQNTLAKSGLFYESHQAQWVMGERPLEHLMQEPQNASASQQSAAQAQTSQQQPTSRQPAPQQPTSQVQAESAVNPVASQSTHTTDDQLKIKESTLPIVRQQIDALESQEFNWNGQVWPGQAMDWQVKAEEDQGNRHAGDPPKVWLSRLRLTLPALGEIDANLRLSPTGVQISLKVSNADTESSLKSQSRMLQKSMEANGIALVSMAVKQHGG